MATVIKMIDPKPNHGEAASLSVEATSVAGTEMANNPIVAST